MALLRAGGVELVTDGVRAADEDNLGGYFEYEPVKKIRQDASWVYAARGKGIKVVSPSLRYLPSDLAYRVVFMRRDLNEVSASQEQMLRRLGKDSQVSSSEIIELLRRHIQETEIWLANAEYMDVLFLDYRGVVEDPLPACRALADFLSLTMSPLDMATAVEKRYYRQRVDTQ